MPLANVIMSRSVDQFNRFDFYAMHIAQQIEHLFHFMKTAYTFLFLYCMTSNQFSEAGLALI